MTKNEFKKIKNAGNEIIRKNTKGCITYENIQKMYHELNSIGITTGLLSFDNKTCEWYYNGIEMENTLYYYSIYKFDTGRLDANIYLT